MTMDLATFTSRFLNGTEPRFDVSDADPHGPGTRIVVTHGDYTVVLQLHALPGHLAVDVHPFVRGEDARAGVFGMEEGRRVQGFPGEIATSHGWPALRMVTVLVGEQVDPTLTYDEIEDEGL